MNEVNEFNVGGSHDTNPLGGIPIGINSNTGAPVTVEEGETKTKIGGQSFIFSNNYKVNKSIINKYNLPSNLEGLTMSDASKKISEIFEDRNDGISNNTKNQFLTRLSDAQEILKQEEYVKVQNALQTNMNTMSEELPSVAPAEAQMMTGPQQMEDGGYQQSWFGTTPGAGAQANSSTAVSNATGAASGIMGLVDQASGNTSPDTGKSALMGAASGAAVGTMIFPGIGTAIGAGVGAIAGYAGAKGAQKKIIKQTNASAMNYNSQFQEQFADGGFPILGNTMLPQHTYGGFKPQPKTKNNLWLQQQYELGQNLNNPDFINKVAPHYATQNPIINAQNYLIGQKYNLNGGADGKWGKSSQAGLDAWRKANNLTNTGGLQPSDYEAMGYTNMGYTPYEEVLDEVVINANATPEVIPDPRVVPEQYQQVTTNNNSENKLKFDTNQMMRMMTPLGNVLQLAQLQKPTMGNQYTDLTKAERNYIDEVAMLRQINNQSNNINRSIQQSGMSEGARRANLLAAGLNNQNAIGNAFIQAQQANRAIATNADALDAQTRNGNIQRRMAADENYQRDLGAYNTEKSKLTAQMFTDIGNIGLEGSRIDKIENVSGYRIDGTFIKNDATGEKYDRTQVANKITELREKSKNAKDSFDKNVYERELKNLERLQKEFNKINEKPTNKNK